MLDEPRGETMADLIERVMEDLDAEEASVALSRALAATGAVQIRGVVFSKCGGTGIAVDPLDGRTCDELEARGQFRGTIPHARDVPVPPDID